MLKAFHQLSTLIPADITPREIFIRFALVFFCVVIWVKSVIYLSFLLLVWAWLLDGGLQKFRQLIHEPFVLAILVLCSVLVIGFGWSEFSGDGRVKWMKYFVLLIYIPFFSLLNKQRLPLAIATILIGYLCVVLVGVYQWLTADLQGVPILKISYLSFSATLGIGVLISVYCAGMYRSILTRSLCWSVALLLLFVQFNQSARGILIATLVSVILLIFLQYRTDIKKFLLLIGTVVLTSLVLAINSQVLHDRFEHFQQDIEQLQQENYKTSIGYRLAIWDVGLDGISKEPLLGYGTGSTVDYFRNVVPVYKAGIYKDISEFQDFVHFHNDWIEIGMHLGLIGLCAFAFLLWGWYRTFQIYRLPIFGAGLIGFIFCAGLTDSFILYNRIPVLLLVVTAVLVSWQNNHAGRI